MRVLAILVALVFCQAQSHAVEWHGLSIAGDDSIMAFDNSQRALTGVMLGLGLSTMSRFTSSQRVASKDPDVQYLSMERLGELEAQDTLPEGQGCLIHMTSHGTENAGFYLSTGETYLDPQYLGQFLDQLCGDRPTVVLVSACFSGQFISDAVTGPNRIILTAARADRPSFGCSADDTYTFWDGCLIEQLPQSATWLAVYQNVTRCIADKEAAIGAEPSGPQAYFGRNAKKWRLFE